MSTLGCSKLGLRCTHIEVTRRKMSWKRMAKSRVLSGVMLSGQLERNDISQKV
jgi:hypothetical protein